MSIGDYGWPTGTGALGGLAAGVAVNEFSVYILNKKIDRRLCEGSCLVDGVDTEIF